MKLLFDENLSPKLPQLLSSDFTGSQHVRDCGLKGFSDKEIWEYARNNGFAIVTKDADFHQRSLLYGHPPKVVWLRVGNCTRLQLITLIKKHKKDILDFEADVDEALLILF